MQRHAGADQGQASDRHPQDARLQFLPSGRNKPTRRFEALGEFDSSTQRDASAAGGPRENMVRGINELDTPRLLKQFATGPTRLRPARCRPRSRAAAGVERNLW